MAATNQTTNDFLSQLNNYGQGQNQQSYVQGADAYGGNTTMINNSLSALPSQSYSQSQGNQGYVTGSPYNMWASRQQTNAYQSPEELSNLQAQDTANLINQAVGIAGQGGYNVPNPAEGMSNDSYNQFLSQLQNMQSRMSVDRRADQALNTVNTNYGGLVNSPVWGQAQEMASQAPGQQNWNLYDAMRTSADSIYDPRAAGISAAASGGAGSSAAQLAANQNRGNYANQVAQMYPQALQAQEALTTSGINRLLAPTLARSGIVGNQTQQIVDILGRLYGSPEFTLNS